MLYGYYIGSSKLYALYNQCLAHFSQHYSFAQLTAVHVKPSSGASSRSSSNVLDLVIEEKPHLSISRPFILRFHQIASFTKKLTNLLQSETSR